MSRRYKFFGLCALCVLAACTTPTAGITDTVIPSLTYTPASTVTPSATPLATRRPTNTVAPTQTLIPGFEEWAFINPQAVQISVEQEAIVLTLERRALWFMTERGVLMYQLVTGNFKFTANVSATKSSDSSRPPGGDGSVQLGGLMARNPSGGTENYVFIVIGNDGNGPSIETKTTLASESQWDGPAWDSTEAELRLCRIGAAFNLYKRHIGADEEWSLAASYQRPDLPETLQVGLNIYTDQKPDLQVRYDQLQLETVTTESSCTE